jgi:WD40 repeat protein
MKCVRVIKYQNSIYSVISPDGQTLALGTGNADKIIVIYNLKTQELVDELEGHSEGINSLVVTHDGSTLISGGRDSEIIIWCNS